MPSARELSCFRRELLLPSQTDLLIKLKWSGKGATLCDLDLSCQLFDVQGRCLEIVDFENTVSNDRAASHGGDAVHEAGGGPTEQVFVDTRRFASQVHAVAVCATNFSSTFDNVGHVEFTVDHLTFVESSQPVDGVGKPWHERTLINVHPLWEATVHASAADRARFYALRPSVPFGDRASAGSDADDERNSKRIMKRRRSRRLRRDPHLVDSTANLCVLFKLARDASANGLVPLWRLDGGLEQSTADTGARIRRAGTRGEMIAAAQQSMSDIFPWLRAAKKRLFSGVAQVCAALSSGALPDMKRAFLAEKGGPELARFSQILFRQLVATHARRNELLRPREAAHVVALLHELFRQIDIDGNGRVDWEEFTNHAVSAGMSAAGADDDDVQRPPGSAARGAADESTVRYVLDAAHAVKRPPGEAQPDAAPEAVGNPGGPARVASTKHAPVHLLLLVPELGRLLVVERDSAALSAYDTAGTYEHAHSFAGAKEASIHDLCYIPERSTLVAALSDHAIHLLTEQLTSAGRHRAYATAGVIVTAALHRRLVWSSTADRLFSVDTASRLYAWDIETAAKTQRPAGAPLVPHSDILMDLIFIKEKGLLATCGLDRAVRLWGIENLRPRGTLAGHTRGVRALAYAQSLLVSGGFDNVAIVWDITSHERACTLAGHRAAICSIELVAPSRDAVTVFTLDDSAECRVWHLARDASGATLHETIRLPGQDPQGPTRALCLPGNAKFSVDDFPDMFVGGARLHHLVPVKATREFAPPACCAYNSTSWHFVAAVGDRVHAWDARSGDYVQRFVAAAPASARAADVSAMCFDEPRQRRLFVGTDVGDLVVLNYVTGAVLFHARPHAAEVAGIAFCADTKCLISVGLDGLLHVHLDSSSALELLRSAENIHRGAAVTCFAYSGPAALILTGDADGEVCVWCFQSLHQFAVIKLGAAAAALRVLDPLMIMLTADAHGELLVWSLAQQPGSCVDVAVSPLCKLGLPENAISPRRGSFYGAQPAIASGISGLACLVRTEASEPARLVKAARRKRKGSRSYSPRSDAEGLGAAAAADWGGASSSDRGSSSEAVSSEESAASPWFVGVYAACESGHVFGWDFDAVALKYPSARAVPAARARDCAAYKPHRKIFRDMTRCVAAAQLMDVSDNGEWDTFPASASRLAHDEAVLHIVAVDDPPCVYTTAADGAQRLWAPATLAPVGDFELPNVQEASLARRTVPPADWKYFSKKPVVVLPEHEAISRALLQEHAAAGRVAPAPTPAKALGAANGSLKRAVHKIIKVNVFGRDVSVSSTSSAAGVQEEWERVQKRRTYQHRARLLDRATLRASQPSLRDTTEGADDEPTEGAASWSTSHRTLSGVRDAAAEEVAAVDVDRRVARRSALAQVKGGAPAPAPAPAPESARRRGPRTLEARSPAAFSSASLNLGLKSGLFDAEGHAKLRGVASVPARRRAYDRRPGDGDLPDLATSASAPNLGGATPRGSVAMRGGDAHPVVRDTQRTGAAEPPGASPRLADAARYADRLRDAMSAPDAGGAVSRAPAVARAPKLPAAKRPASNANLLTVAAPWYGGADVNNFRDAFNFVDVDLGGTIDMDEWFLFLQRMDQKLSKVDAMLLFLQIDVDRDGTIRLGELIGIVFEKCAPEARRNITLLIEDLNFRELRSRSSRFKIQVADDRARFLRRTPTTLALNDSIPGQRT